jgi:hypothetical protein
VLEFLVAGVHDSKVVHHESKRNVASLVAKQTGAVGTLDVFVRFEMLD